MRFVWILLGILGLLFGVFWTLQGLNIVTPGNSFMNGNTMWAIIGPIVAVIGLLLLLVGVRRRRAG